MPEPDERDLDALRADADQWRAAQTEPLSFDRAFRTVRRHGYARRGFAAGAALVVVAAVAVGVWNRPGQSDFIGHPVTPDSQTAAAGSAPTLAAQASGDGSASGAAAGGCGPSSTAKTAFAAMTWQLHTMTDKGKTTTPTDYPLNLAVNGSTFVASAFARTDEGSVALDGCSLSLAVTQSSIADMPIPPTFSGDLGAMSAETSAYLDVLPTMTSYRLDGDTLVLADGSQSTLTFHGVPKADLGALEKLVRLNGTPNPGTLVRTIQAVKTTYGAFTAADVSQSANPTEDPPPANNTSVWVIEWQGTSIPDHGVFNCPARSAGYTSASDCPPRGNVSVAVIPADPIGDNIDESLLATGVSAHTIVDLSALGTPVVLPPF